jgi:hypothetical protein
MANHSFGKRGPEFVHAQNTIDVQENCGNEFQQQLLTARNGPFSLEPLAHHEGQDAQTLAIEVEISCLSMEQKISQSVFGPATK